MTPREVLVAARKLIERPEAWTQGVFARDADGRVSWPMDEAATCFCSSGALRHVAGYTADYDRAWDVLARAAGGVFSVVDFNDAPERTHAEVLAAFDRAIEACP